MYTEVKKFITIHGHFINLRRVVLFNVPENSDVIGLDKVDRNTLAAKTT